MIQVKRLLARLKEAAREDRNVGAIGLLLEEAAEVIESQMRDIEDLRRMGADHS